MLLFLWDCNYQTIYVLEAEAEKEGEKKGTKEGKEDIEEKRVPPRTQSEMDSWLITHGHANCHDHLLHIFWQTVHLPVITPPPERPLG